MAKALSPTEIAIGDINRFYHTMFEPQLAAYHRVPRWRIRAWKEGRMGPVKAEETIQNLIHIGGLGSGKSKEQRFQELSASALIQDNYIIIVRKRWEELQNHVIYDLREFTKELVGAKRIDAIMSEPRRIGSSFEIVVKTLGKPSRIVVKNEPEGSTEDIAEHFKGPEYGAVSLEEARQLQKITFDTLTGRLRRKFFYQFPKELWEAEGRPMKSYDAWVRDMSKYLWVMLAVCNPPYEGHWIDTYSKRGEKDEKMDALKRESILIVRSNMYDNEYLPESYCKTQEELYKDDPIQRAMLIEGKNGIRIDGVPVYGNEFKSMIHTSRDIGYNPFKPILVGLDFGYLRPAAVFVQETDEDQYNAIGELCLKNKQAEELGEAVLEYRYKCYPKHAQVGAPMMFFGDHAGTQRSDKGDTTVERLAAMGIQVMTQRLDFEDSLNSVRKLFTKMIDGRPRLMVNNMDCPTLTQALIGGYHYRMRSGQKEPKPHKTTENHFDDVCDALRYVMANVVGPHGNSVLHYYDGVDDGPIYARGISGERGGP